jgi:hypothetical protein
MSNDEVERRIKPPGLLTRALGPFADALGLELAKLPAAATRNIVRLGEAFRRKAGEADDPTVSPRLFRQIMDEATWADEEIVAEYLGGVLASSTKGIVRGPWRNHHFAHTQAVFARIACSLYNVF